MVRWKSVVTGGVVAAAVLSGFLSCCLSGCARRPKAPSVGMTDARPGAEWGAEELVVIKDLDVPECLLPDPAAGVVYISNIETAREEYWGDDGKAFISLVSSEGEMKEMRWLDSTPDAPLNAPKGMCILGGLLYFTDNSRLMRSPIDRSGPVEQLSAPRGERLNDLAAHAEAVYVSDTGAGVVYRVDPAGGTRQIKAPEGVNGITFHGGKMFAVSWKLHEVYELDPSGEEAPKPFGVADHFTNLDGIEVLGDGTFIVSDFTGNKVSTIAPDRKTVRTLAELETPADIGLDRGRGLLYVPQLKGNKAVVYRLKRR